MFIRSKTFLLGIIVVVIAAVISGIVVAFHHNNSGGAASSPTAHMSSPATAPTVTSATPDPLQSLVASGVPDSPKYATSGGSDKNETPYVDPSDCSIHLSKASYAALTKRVWAYYEQVAVYSYDSTQLQEAIKQFGTKKFIAFNAVSSPTPAPPTDAMRLVRQYSSLSCVMSGDQPQVVFKPAYVPASDPSDDDAVPTTSDTSDWVLQGKTWRINTLVNND